MTVQRIAVLGDVHGCIEELKQLYSVLSYLSLDGIWSVGDIVDRGSDSGAVVEFCRTHQIKLVCGNHESTMRSIHKTTSRKARNQTITRSMAQIDATENPGANWAYLISAPYLWAIDDLGVLLVHGGVWPRIPISKQASTHAVAIAQAINPNKLGDTVWYEKAERANRLAGYQKYVPWQDLYDGPENVVYGHTVYDRPRLVQNAGTGWTLGIDTGVPFGGSLTAVVLPERTIVQVQARTLYCADEGTRPLPPPFHNQKVLTEDDAD